MTPTSKYKHIIWDWNGTLLNDAWLFVDVMNTVLRRRNMPLLDVEKYRQIFGFPVKDYYIKLGFDLDQEAFESSGMEFIREYEKRRYDAKLYDDTVPTLDRLSSNGISHSILSAQNQSTLDDLVDYYGIRKYMINISGLDNHYAHSKVDNGRAWMERLHFGPHEVLFVGDTNHDHEVAEAIGADCVLLASGHHSRQRLEATGAPVLEGIGEVVGFVEGA